MDDRLDRLCDSDTEVRAAARMSLVEDGEAAVPLLIHALQTSNDIGKREAIHGLGELRATAGVSVLLAALASEPYDVAAWAARGLGEIGDRRATPALVALLGDEAMLSVGAQALAALGDPAGLPPLVAAMEQLRDRFDYGAYLGRYWISFALVRLGDRSPSTVETICEVIDRDFGPDTQQTWGAFRDTAVDLLFEIVDGEVADKFLKPFLSRERETLQLRYKIARHYWLAGDQSLRLRGILERMARHPLYPKLAGEARDLLATEN